MLGARKGRQAPLAGRYRLGGQHRRSSLFQHRLLASLKHLVGANFLHLGSCLRRATPVSLLPWIHTRYFVQNTQDALKQWPLSSTSLFFLRHCGAHIRNGDSLQFAVINFSSRRYHRSQTPNVLRRRWTVARGYKPAARYHFHMLH